MTQSLYQCHCRCHELPNFETQNLTKKFIDELKTNNNDYVYKIDERTSAIVTPICLISFCHETYKFSFPLPTDFDPECMGVIIKYSKPITF